MPMKNDMDATISREARRADATALLLRHCLSVGTRGRTAFPPANAWIKPLGPRAGATARDEESSWDTAAAIESA